MKEISLLTPIGSTATVTILVHFNKLRDDVLISGVHIYFKGRKCLRKKVLQFGRTAKYLRFCGKKLLRLVVLYQFCGINVIFQSFLDVFYK